MAGQTWCFTVDIEGFIEGHPNTNTLKEDAQEKATTKN